MPASDLIRAARETNSLTQRELAKLVGLAQPRIAEIESDSHNVSFSRIEELLKSLHLKITYIESPLITAWETAIHMADALKSEKEDLVWRHFIQLNDDLNRAEDAMKVALAITEAPSTGEENYDALIAGLVDHVLSSHKLPLPSWVVHKSRYLSKPWDVEPIPALQGAARKSTPKAFRSRGIFLSSRELQSV